MSTPTTHTGNSNSSMSPEEALQFVEAGMNLAGHVITDPHLQELCASAHTVRFPLRNVKKQEYVISWVARNAEALRVGRLLHPRNARPPELFFLFHALSS